ncbi:hypothetical protein K525DRAFT_275006 [Schizophyllum commune Loenen D]|nr:hypothetical protein K525DRAFT_275006 [Schizophyllum commune Loenen D]
MPAVLGCAPVTTDNRRETRHSVQGTADVDGCSPVNVSVPLLAAPYDPPNAEIARAFSVALSRTASPSSRTASPAASAAALPLPVSAVPHHCLHVSVAQNGRELWHARCILRDRLCHQSTMPRLPGANGP